MNLESPCILKHLNRSVTAVKFSDLVVLQNRAKLTLAFVPKKKAWHSVSDFCLLAWDIVVGETQNNRATILERIIHRLIEETVKVRSPSVNIRCLPNEVCLLHVILHKVRLLDLDWEAVNRTLFSWPFLEQSVPIDVQGWSYGVLSVSLECVEIFKNCDVSDTALNVCK